MQSISTSPFNLSMLRKRNTWYTVKDGNWSDPGIWMGNGTKHYTCPQVGDDVYINNTVTIDISLIHIRNLYISGLLRGTSALATNITLDGDCQVSGSGLIDLSLNSHNLILNGYNNLIPYAGFIAGANSTVIYNGYFDQYLLNIPYKNLTTQNGYKYQISDISVGGNFNQQSNYECGTYNLSVNGTSTLGLVGQYVFSKNSAVGSILFVGPADFEGGTNLIGNPNIEFRGGLTIHTFSLITGSGTVTFSTNNQTINCSAYLGGSWNANIVIQGSITVTLVGGTPFQVNNSINGTVSGSTFNNEGILYLGYNSTPMSTGIFNYQHTTTSTLGYVFNGSYILPYSTYANLYVAGTGTKSLGANTTINQALINNGNFECAGYNVTVVGSFTNSGGGNFTTNAFCNIVFGGFAEFTIGSGSGYVDLRIGNPNVEFRNGWDVHTFSCYTGTGTFSFTTNNQSLSFSAYNGGLFACNVLISGAITVTYTNGSAPPPLTGTLNGDNSSSTFNCQGAFNYQNAQQPMGTGRLYCDQTSNTFTYGASGNQNITVPSDGGYYNLIVSSVTASLTGNTIVNNNLTINGTLELSTFNLTVGGATTYNGTLSKSGAGSVSLNTLASGSSVAVLALSGNPTVNLSGNVSGDGTAGMNFGTGTVNILQNLSFGVYMSGTASPNLTCSFLIASGKTFTNIGLSAGAGGFKTTGTINGVSSSSIFDNRSVCAYKNSTAPMLTGLLYCNQATNTFTYGSGNQNITPPSDPISPGYVNLTLNGTGIKKLLGNVSVKGVYTLTAPATLNSNGFSLTNP